MSQTEIRTVSIISPEIHKIHKAECVQIYIKDTGVSGGLTVISSRRDR